MVVIGKKVGRLANRLLLFSHFIATAVEHGFTVMDPALEPYSRYFPATAGDLLCRFPPARMPMPAIGFTTRRLFYLATLRWADVLYAMQQRGHDVGLIRLRRTESLNLDSEQFLAAVRRHRLLFVQDWFFRSKVNCRKHADVIRAFFTPLEQHRSQSERLVASARNRGRFLVGVHLRQGDYATFKDGRFFYSHQQYRHVMDQVQAVFPDQNVAFFMCSDAPLAREMFSDFDMSYGNGHELEDLYALAACDRVIGPPSTYSQWASFYGSVPRYQIWDPAAAVTASQFRIAENLVGTQPADRPAVEFAPPPNEMSAP